MQWLLHMLRLVIRRRRWGVEDRSNSTTGREALRSSRDNIWMLRLLLVLMLAAMPIVSPIARPVSPVLAIV